MKRRLRGDMPDLAKIITDGEEAILRTLNEKQQAENREIIESVEIDFNEILNLISLIQETGKRPDAKDFQNYFYIKWAENAPRIFVSIMKKAVQEGSPSAKEFLDEILAMGSKLKTIVDSNLCVSPTVPPDCKNCYFGSICKLKF